MAPRTAVTLSEVFARSNARLEQGYHTAQHLYQTGAAARRLAPCGARRRGSVSTVSTAAVAGAASQAPSQQAPIRVPQSISEVDNGKILGFGADLAEDHPGWGDRAYAQRRSDICNTARAHEIGRPIPEVEYSAEETATWGEALNELIQLYPTAACREFLASFPAFGFTPDRVPQLQDLTEVLERETGWRIRPVAGLLHPRDFLNGLAFKTFHSTQYVRHASQPSYTPEPDVIHELLGHVPMLVDPAFCDLVHNIGLASLGADEKEIWHLTKIYWYTVEFGVVREVNGIKAFGAGILSSFGELQHMLAGRAELVNFDPFAKQPKMSYKDGFQKRYFVLNSFEDGAAKLKAYCKSLSKRAA